MLLLTFALASVLPMQPPGVPATVLTATDRTVLESGQQIVREERVPDSPWPRVTVLQLVDASPQEAAAVFIDYDSHSSFLPGVKKSAVSRRVSPRVAEVDYVLYVPLFPDEHYTVRDSLSRPAGGGGYRVEWSKVRARSTKTIVGSVQLDPYRNARTGLDVTLVTYVNLVVPGQRLAGPLKGRALKQVRETVVALGKQIELVRAHQPELLAAQVAALAEALSIHAPPPYPGGAAEGDAGRTSARAIPSRGCTGVTTARVSPDGLSSAGSSRPSQSR